VRFRLVALRAFSAEEAKVVRRAFIESSRSLSQVRLNHGISASVSAPSIVNTGAGVFVRSLKVNINTTRRLRSVWDFDSRYVLANCCAREGIRRVFYKRKNASNSTTARTGISQSRLGMDKRSIVTASRSRDSSALTLFVLCCVSLVCQEVA
jgi:hypothetical protein